MRDALDPSKDGKRPGLIAEYLNGAFESDNSSDHLWHRCARARQGMSIAAKRAGRVVKDLAFDAATLEFRIP